ncbi:MAG: tRNA pseudouridine(38-40) synthase TruA [Synechococcales cyanobacterium]
MGRRLAIKVQYLGSQFFGWQRQANHRSVQADLETAIASRAGHGVVIHGAGRTDTGVHAAAQVAHFDTTSPIPVERWPMVLNNCLPSDLSVLEAAEVPTTWHARFSATWRRYRYLILQQDQRDVFWDPYVWHHRQGLDAKAMQAALHSLLGDQNLEAFRLAGSKRRHSWVTVQDVRCERQGSLIAIEVQASGFLYRMMRLLVGTLVFVGRGELTVPDFIRLWQERQLLGTRFRLTVPPQGLCLLGIGYAEDPFRMGNRGSPPFSLPVFPPPLHLLTNWSVS